MPTPDDIGEILEIVGRGDDVTVQEWLRSGGQIPPARVLVKLLMHTAFTGSERLVEVLLQHGADVNMQNSDGLTALMMATGMGHEQVVDLLLRHSAQINMQNSKRGFLSPP